MSDERFHALEARIAELELRLTARDGSAVDGAGDDVGDGEQRVSRRGLLTTAGAAAVGAVVATVAAAVPAGANDTNPLTIGATNNNNNPGGETILNGATAASDSAMLVVGQGISGGAQAAGIKGTSAVAGGIGVIASAAAGTGVVVGAPTADGAHLGLKPATGVGPPVVAGINHAVGELRLDAGNVLWHCVAQGAPGTWVRFSPLIPLASPVRIYNSALTVEGPFSVNEERPIIVTNGTTIPNGVSAVLTNLAANNPGGTGFLAMYKQGTAWPGTSNLNYRAGVTISNNATSAISAANQVTVRCGGAATNVVVDVFGYHR